MDAVIAGGTATLIVAVARLAFGVPLPGLAAGFVLAVVFAAAALRSIGDHTPLGAAVQALQDASAGSWPHAGQLAVMAGYAVVSAALAIRLFRWQ
jgi:hypothetical protein